MKSVQLKWVRTALVGTVSPKMPRGMPYIVSYLRICQQVITQPPPKGFASQEGVRQLQIGMALDALVSEHIEAIGALDKKLEAIQDEIAALQREMLSVQNDESADVQANTIKAKVATAQAVIWDVELPYDVELLLEDAPHKRLVELLEEADFQTRTLAIREMIDEIKAAPSVDVEKKQAKQT